MAATTPMLIRVQANGGKFLADDIGGAEVTVRDARTGRWLAGGRAQGPDSGTLQPNYVPSASRSAVVTPGNPPVVQWLVPGPTTSGLTVDLPITQPTLLEVEVYGPLGGLQSAQRVVTRAWAVPGVPITQGPGFVVELPGLIVQIQQPPTHLEYAKAPDSVSFLVNVTMMCGCPIGKGLAWIPDDFTITAAVERIGSGEPPATVHFSVLQNPSIFQGSFDLKVPGFYQAAVTAVQKSTGNTGTGTVTFFTKP
ncbi:MAG TPA: hypothetical protein VFR03_13985 [Thermoanaerobaculia bacterium]|nr:hypothetical protein [Thermoanaerobaculia bacterium]